MATTIEYPMELDIVNPTNGNAFWVNVNGPFWYGGRYRFDRFADPSMPSGEALMTFKTNIPRNLASPANLDIVFHHMAASGSEGAGAAALIHVSASRLGSGDTPGAPTVIVPNKLIGVDVSGDHNITRLAGLAGVSNFDALLPVVAGEYLEVIVRREPLTISGDTILGGWDMVLPPLLRIDVQ